MTNRDPRKISVDLPGSMVDELHRESKRQDRSVSKLLQMAWGRSKDTIRAYTPVEVPEAPAAPPTLPPGPSQPTTGAPTSPAEPPETSAQQ